MFAFFIFVGWVCQGSYLKWGHLGRVCSGYYLDTSYLYEMDKPYYAFSGYWCGEITVVCIIVLVFFMISILSVVAGLEVKFSPPETTEEVRHRYLTGGLSQKKAEISEPLL